MKEPMNAVMLRNGVEIPQVGLGTWQITDRELMKSIIGNAYECGYRLLDTAAAYSNEIALAKAISSAAIPRNELFLSDKAWNTSRGFSPVQEACRKSLKKLKTDYFDLYLIHWPASKKLHPDWEELNAETWRGMEQLYRDGLVRAIGVCNFKVHHLETLKKTAQVMPFVNQVECHPGMNQQEIVDYCNDNDIKVEASSPLGNGQILSHPQLKEIADSKHKTVAQVCGRWGIQKGFIIIPKTSNVSRLRENIDIFDFALTEEEMSVIDGMPYCGGIGIDSDEVIEFG